MDFAVSSDLAIATSNTEDGEPDHCLVFYVLAQAPDGRRWCHEHSRTNGKVHRMDEGYNTFVRDNGEAEAAINGLRDLIEKAFKAGHKLDLNHWNETDPAYGSEAYQALDAVHYFADREKMDAADAGEISPHEANRLMIG